MPEAENSKKMPYFWGIIGIIVILVLILVTALIQTKIKGYPWWVALSFWFKWSVYALVGVGILGLIIYAVWWLFSKQPTDSIYLNRERFISACKLNSSESPQELYFKGSDEWAFKKIGSVIGVCRVKIMKTDLTKPLMETVLGTDNKPELDEKGEPKKIPKKIKLFHPNGELMREVQAYEKKELIEDVIAFKRKGFFSDIEMVRVLQEERTDLSGEIIFLRAMSFTPKLYGFYYLPNRFRDKETIDREVADEIHRATIQHILGEEQNIVDESIAISPRHQKELDKTKMQIIQSGSNPAQTIPS